MEGKAPQQLRWGTENHAQLSMTSLKIWVFPKIGVPQNGWFIMKNPMNKWMIWGVNTPIFGSTPIFRWKDLWQLGDLKSSSLDD